MEYFTWGFFIYYFFLLSILYYVNNKNFEKIRSVVERDSILERVLTAQHRLLIKGKGDNLGLFKTLRVNNSRLLGQIEALHGRFLESQPIVANLKLEDERYFFQSDIVPDDGLFEIPFPKALFLLQRRAFKRFSIDQAAGRASYILKVNGDDANYFVECLDVSAGGARIHFHGGSFKFQSGDQLQLQLNIKGKWSFELNATIRYIAFHDDRDQIFGISFDKDDKTLLPRLSLMIMDLQKQNLFAGA